MLEHIPELNQFSNKEQNLFSSTLFNFAGGIGLPHKVHEDKFFLGSTYIRDYLGGAQFYSINEKYHLFDFSEEYNYHANIGRTCCLTSEALTLVSTYYQSAANCEPSPIVDHNGRRIVKDRENPVGAKISGTTITAKAKASFGSIIEINISNLQHLIDSTLKKHTLSARDHKIIYATRGLIDEANNSQHFGCVNQWYRQDKHARLQGIGLHLQNCPKEVRNAALAGLYYYDLENCHFSILQNCARIYGLRCPSIDYYIAEKQNFRKELATKFGPTGNYAVDLAIIKSCLLALVYGASLRT